MKPSRSKICKDFALTGLYEEPSDKKPLILAGDTEDDSKGKTLMVNFFDGKNHFTFRNTEAALEWLLAVSRKHKRGVELWFANTQYDIGNLCRESQEFLSFTLAGGRFITGRVAHEKIKFKDILNVIPGASVKSLGKMIGFEKKEVNGNFDDEEYCQRDTEIVYWALLKFKATLATLNIELKNTAASTGFTALLKQFDFLSANAFSTADHEFMQQGYYGGRTEVFNTAVQKGEIHSYDIISSYPAVMRDMPLVDTRTKIYTKNPKIFTREGMSDCMVEAPEKIEVPYLPVRHFEDDGTFKLIFPKGRFRGVWTYFELREALKRGYRILTHYRSVEFKANFSITLETFIEKLFAVREKASEAGDEVLKYACKIILNACYGKFAMGNEKTELVAFDEFHKIKGDFTSEVFPNNQIIVKKTTKFAPSTNFMHGAGITARGRHKWILKAEEIVATGRTLIYGDTDSVYFKGPKFEKNGSKLGEWKHEHSIKECQFILPKTYYVKFKTPVKAGNGFVKEVYKCKGVKGDLAKEFFTKGYAEVMQPLKYVETCRKNFFIKNRNEKNGTKEPYIPFNVWVKKPKSKKAKYNKRVVLKNGDTRAIKLEYEYKEEGKKNANRKKDRRAGI